MVSLEFLGSSSSGKENTLKDLLQLYYKESETTDGKALNACVAVCDGG